MGHAQAAAGFDRLPWLADEPTPRQPRGNREVAAWAVAATLLVAAASYWLGTTSASVAPWQTTVVPLPQPRAAEPAPTVEPAVPVVASPAPVAPPIVTRKPIARPAPVRTATAKRRPVARAKPAPPADSLTPWPARAIAGASGRLVRVGTFRTVRQAKKGWWAIVRNNPSLKRLPALVVPAPSLRDGRTYYRLQMGTTSQAHSEVLCQRMRMIGQSCIVVGLSAPSRSRAA